MRKVVKTCQMPPIAYFRITKTAASVDNKTLCFLNELFLFITKFSPSKEKYREK